MRSIPKRLLWIILSLIILIAVVLIAGAPLSADGQPLLGGSCLTQADNPTRAAAAQLLAADDQSVDPYEGLLPAVDADSRLIEIRADSLGRPAAQDDLAARYARPSVVLGQGDSVQFSVTIPSAGEYTLAFDVAAPADSTVPEARLSIDGEYPLRGLERFVFPVFYRSSSHTFPRDRYGNDALSSQERAVRWSTSTAHNTEVSEPYPLRVTLAAGEHTFEFTLTEGALYLGSIYLRGFTPYPDYTDYLAAQTAPDASDFSITLEAEMPSYKNDTSVRPNSSRSLTVTPYDTYCLLLNTLGGDSWIKSGSAVYYAIDAPQDGLYAITLRALQSTRSNFTVFRRITINGEVPFEQLNAVAFPSSSDWLTMTLGGAEPYRIHLREGVNVIGIEATNAPYLPAIETIQAALLDINTLALEINRLTGNQRDPYREWVISDYIPDIQERLNAIAQRLIDDKDTLVAIDESSASPEVLTYQLAIDNLLFLAADPNQIPIYMTRFSEGTGSAAQLLGSLLPLLQNQPLALDTITVHAPDRVPDPPSVPVTTSLVEDIRRFVSSFQPDPYQAVGVVTDELEVWVNRPRQYVNLLQLMADTSFTPQTGIRVRFSIMPDESKLVLANAAEIQPDVALGVSTQVPYELAIRNALYDLRSFDDFDSFINLYSPGSLLGYIINDSVYAIPETQDFWVTFYRHDILDSLGLPVPQTWTEVIEILPELQRYGMNYNTPLSSGSGQRNYLLTAPYLFNYGAELYSEGGFATGLQSDQAVAAIRFMADSFTIYGMPLSTVSFYEAFRSGTLPIGISNAETYVKLMTAAQELGGLWDIDLYPATVLPDGTQNRYTVGSAQTSMMFRNTDMPDEGWEFMKWWMSTETQTDFQERLVLNYGPEYLWFSANLDAFSQLSIPQQHRSVILNQWQWLREPVRLPGSYMQEREISNIWIRMVFDGVNPRVAIDRSVSIINREITRKMEEFGYLQDGVQVREFTIPTIETVEAWMRDD